MNNDKNAIIKNISVLDHENNKSKNPKIRSIINVADPTEQMFRSMMNRIQNVDKDIKRLTSQNLKQTTFLDHNTLKRKANEDYNLKKLKNN